ncbi:MAG: rRNA (uracil1498-N3)-methyltransferase [Bacillota bacterium]|jgi:16S rRNA (uracil1498-N3)-methyltransferase|nr:rRNA (uracil1498-N3)-methyltransferase [Bacillota bacterium]
MQRFYAPPEHFTGGRVHLSAEEAHHVCRVLRLGPGAQVYVFDGLGREYLVEIEIANGRAVSGRILAELPQGREAPLALTLAQGLAKGDKLELVIQKATEIGVQAVIPLHTARSVVKPSEGTRRTERWQRIAREATKQCGRAFVPRIESITTLRALSERFGEFDAVFIFWEEERARRLKAALAELAERGSVRRLLILVGPEGGFTPDEVGLVVEAGALPVTLGPRILRTETAGLVAASIILYELGDLG